MILKHLERHSWVSTIIIQPFSKSKTIFQNFQFFTIFHENGAMQFFWVHFLKSLNLTNFWFETWFGEKRYLSISLKYVCNQIFNQNSRTQPKKTPKTIKTTNNMEPKLQLNYLRFHYSFLQQHNAASSGIPFFSKHNAASSGITYVSIIPFFSKHNAASPGT